MRPNKLRKLLNEGASSVSTHMVTDSPDGHCFVANKRRKFPSAKRKSF